MSGIEQWWADGERVGINVGDTRRMIFVRRLGSGSSMTLLHGFPSSSHDWAKMTPLLGDRFALLMPDFLGFGASEKPPDHEYSLTEQADVVEALWAHEQVTGTALVAHDYAVSVAQELLARQDEGRLGVTLESVHLLNGGLYPDLHRPQPVQTALLDPNQGPQLAAALTEDLLTAALQPTFGANADARAESSEIWRSLTRDHGHLLLPRLIRYMPDRVANSARWVSALDTADVPLKFIWGMLDPISGAHVAERIRERHPGAPLLALDDVGHWPPLEAPDRVVAALLDS